MRTYLDCIPCFFKQALEAARIAGANPREQSMVMRELTRALPKIPLKSSPPEVGRLIYGLAKKISRKKDPFKKIKQESNRLALRFYCKLKKKVSSSSDRLLIAVELAIAGNVIDYGAKNYLDVDRELEKILNEESVTIEKEKKSIFNFKEFKNSLKKARKVLYIADNAGETVFDKILIEEMKRLDKDKRIIYAVKEKPIINDALIEDAYMCGIDGVADVVSSGSDAPGTVLALCSKKFLKIYRDADMIISKGQGNFEALPRKGRPIFFLFMAKCPVVAMDVGCGIGDIILLYTLAKKKKEVVLWPNAK